jgi:hypothetical protein
VVARCFDAVHALVWQAAVEFHKLARVCNATCPIDYVQLDLRHNEGPPLPGAAPLQCAPA